MADDAPETPAAAVHRHRAQHTAAWRKLHAHHARRAGELADEREQRVQRAEREATRMQGSES